MYAWKFTHQSLGNESEKDVGSYILHVFQVSQMQNCCWLSHFFSYTTANSPTSIHISLFTPTSAFRPGNCLWSTFSNSPENFRHEPLGLPLTMCPRIDGRQVLQYIIWQVYIWVIHKVNNLWGKSLWFGWNRAQHAEQGMDINQRKITG